MLTTGKYRAVFDACADLVVLPPWGPYRPGVWLEMQCLQESGGNPAARHYDAPPDKKFGDAHDAGDFEEWASFGLFQIEGRTFRQMYHFAPQVVINYADMLGRPLLNLAVALRIHKENLFTYAGSVERALAAYNGGPSGANDDGTGNLVRQDYVEAVRRHGAAVLADRGIA